MNTIYPMTVIAIVAGIVGLLLWLNVLAGRQVKKARELLSESQKDRHEIENLVDKAQRSQSTIPSQYAMRNFRFENWAQYEVMAVYASPFSDVKYHKIIKVFPYDQKDPDDMDFAKLEAEELLEMLKD